MAELLIMQDESNNPFEKRTKEQRQKDRQFITDCLLHNPELSKKDIYLALVEEIGRREKENAYDLHYAYVCTEVNKIKKELRQESRYNLDYEIDRSLELINDNIKMCVAEIQLRFTARKDVTTVVEDLILKDSEKLSIEETYLYNKLREKVKHRKVSIRDIRAGQDVKEMMEILLKFLERKAKLLGEDQPTKLAQRVTHDIEIQSMDETLLRNELIELNYDPEPFIKALKEGIKKQN